MKSMLLALLLTTAVIQIVPDASAVGTCTKVTNNVNDPSAPDCPYLFCYGTSWGYPDRYVHCYECFDPSHAECDWPRLP